MSGAFIYRLYRRATAGRDDDDGNTGATEETVQGLPVPRVIQSLENLSKERCDDARTYHFLMHTKVRLLQHGDGRLAVANEQDVTFNYQESEHRYLFVPGVEQVSAKQLPIVLSITRTGYDMTQIPVDLQAHLAGLLSQFDCEDSLSDDAFKRHRVFAVDDVLDAGLRATQVRQLLIGARIFQGQSVQTTFSSLDAVGFEAGHFYNHIVTRVSDGAAVRLKRLFWKACAPLSRPASVSSLHTAFAGIPAIYTVPLTYKYTRLVVAVHAYLSAQEVQSDVSFASGLVDPQLYKLPTSRHYVFFEQAALHDAVDFINNNLIGIHRRIFPHSLTALISPLLEAGWDALASKRKIISIDSIDRRLDDASGRPAELTLTIEHQVYYTFLNGAENPPAPPRLPSHSFSHTDSSLETESLLESSSDDDDDVSLDFQTPRTAAPTPRVLSRPSLNEFINIAKGATAAAESETIPDPWHVPMRTSLGAPRPAPPKPVGPVEQPAPAPAVAAAALQKTPARIMARVPPHLELAGAAQSDDYSEASVSSAEPTFTSDASTVSDTKMQLARTVLTEANRRLLLQQQQQQQQHAPASEQTTN